MAAIAVRRKRQGLSAKRMAFFLRLLSVVCFLVLWQWYSSVGNSLAVAPPVDVLSSMWDGLTTGEILEAASGTVQALVVGYALSILIGVAVGVAIGVSRWAKNAIEPLVQAAYSTPMSLLIPFVGIQIGLDFRGRVFIVIAWCIFEIIMNTITGVRESPSSVIEMARAFGARKADIYRKVVLPSALPHLLVGLKLGMGKALRGAIAAEILLSVTNLGRLMATAQSTFNIDLLLAVILFIVLWGYVLMRVFEYIEERAFPWSEVHTADEVIQET